MKLNPLVSICIPTYNQNPVYLKKCIESAINQTYKNIEIIINNNNTTNESLSYLKHLSEEAGKITEKKIKISTNEHTVIMRESIDQAIQNATGDYLFILPSDDFLEKNAIEVLVNALQQHPDADSICGQWCRVDKEFNKVGSHKNQLHYEKKELRIYDSLRQKTNYFVFALIRAKYLKTMDIWLNKKIQYYSDVFFTNQVTLHGKVVVIENNIAFYQTYNTPRKGRVIGAIIDHSEILYHTINDIVEDKNLKNKMSRLIIAKIILIHFKNKIISLMIITAKLAITPAQLINTFVYVVKMSFLSIMLLNKL